jgi:hypothetical protein
VTTLTAYALEGLAVTFGAEKPSCAGVSLDELLGLRV